MMLFKLNNFSFDGEYYQQVSGVAMGTKMVPSYANLFVGYVEQQIFEQYSGPIPDFFGRYIDDCLGMASCTRVDLERFINYVNGFHLFTSLFMFIHLPLIHFALPPRN